jgi:hypothetical protein
MWAFGARCPLVRPPRAFSLARLPRQCPPLGIAVNFASGDAQILTKIQYPGADPWITAVGGTNLTVGANDHYLGETGWATDETQLDSAGTGWQRAPGGRRPRTPGPRAP